MTNNPQHDTDMAERLMRIETIVERLESRLLGNGQPGELDLMRTRLYMLEKLEAKGRGALWIVGLIISALTGGGLIHIFKVGLR